jgi:hypothetical protein
MKALISPEERRGDGCRVAQVSVVSFPVAEPLFWVDCDDTVHSNMIYVDGVFVEPEPGPEPEPEVQPRPTPPSGEIPVTEA